MIPCAVDGCLEEAEVFWPDPNRPGEQRGYCAVHEPIYRGKEKP